MKYDQLRVHADVHEYNQHTYLYRTGYVENGKLPAANEYYERWYIWTAEKDMRLIVRLV